MAASRCLMLAVLALGTCVPVAISAPSKPRLSLSRNVVFPGQHVRVAGHGFPARARVRLVLAGRKAGRPRAGPKGGFRSRIRIPRRLAAGRYVLAARSRGVVTRRRLRVKARRQRAPVQPGPRDPVTLAAAGDIACPPGLGETATACRQAHTANIVESLNPDAVAALGDNQYAAELASFTAIYDPTWGRFRGITHPAAGNHEYHSDPERDQAPGYFSYFGAAAGDPLKGYYRWQLGGWTVVVLNSGDISWTRAGGGNPSLPDDCWPVSCAAGSEQERWLRAELDALPNKACVIAYWHYPRFSSGFGGANQPYPETGALFAALHEHGVELLLTAHAHNYERFVPVTPDGAPDPAGVRQFIVGTGGRGLDIDPGPQAPGSEVLRTDVFGVLELTLKPGAYAARFVGEDGAAVDQTSGTCHPRPAAGP